MNEKICLWVIGVLLIMIIIVVLTTWGKNRKLSRALNCLDEMLKLPHIFIEWDGKYYLAAFISAPTQIENKIFPVFEAMGEDIKDKNEYTWGIFSFPDRDLIEEYIKINPHLKVLNLPCEITYEDGKFPTMYKIVRISKNIYECKKKDSNTFQ